jgi:hypothetical protein
MDAGEALVVGVIQLRGAGRGSGAPLDTELGIVYELRDGKIVREQPFRLEREALGAAELSE